MLPLSVHSRPVEAVAAVPAATLGAIAAARTPSDVAAGPQAAAPVEVAVWPAPAMPAESPLVPAQRQPSEQSPDRHDDRESGGNGAGPPSPSATPMTRVAMWGAPRAGGSSNEAVAGDCRGWRDETPSLQKSGQVGLGRAQLHGTKGLARRPGDKPATGTGTPAGDGAAEVRAAEIGAARAGVTAAGAAAVRAAEARAAAAGPAEGAGLWPEPARPPERPRRGRGFKVGVTLALVLALAASLAFLLKRPGGAAHAIAPTPGPSTSAPLGTAAEVRDATAAWVACEVSRARPISCDPVMCQALRADGVPVADLLMLKPGGGDPLHSGVIVVTPAVIKMVRTASLPPTRQRPSPASAPGAGRILSG